MRTMMTAMALAAGVWGCDAKAALSAPGQAPVNGATYSVTVKIDDV